jgi:hypothetical protein
MQPRKCPICQREVTALAGIHPFPFCSPRCKLVDLGNWLDQRYVVGSDASDDGEGESLPTAGRERP